jgi:hypothetical protein
LNIGVEYIGGLVGYLTQMGSVFINIGLVSLLVICFFIVLCFYFIGRFIKTPKIYFLDHKGNVFLVTGGSSRFNCNEMNPFITS